MIDLDSYNQEIQSNGFAIIEHIYSEESVAAMLAVIDQLDTSSSFYRKTNELYAIRRFLKEVPAIQPLIFNSALKQVIDRLFDAEYFVVKSIYFDKPATSNWFVAYHQDLMISVDSRQDLPGFGPWSVKQEQYAVQPPLSILEKNFTIRIHLDDTDEGNGTLRVIPGSHLKGVYRAVNIDWNKEVEATCNVARGGIMIMKPLLLHASCKSTDQRQRRVIHIEFSNQELPEPLTWAERQ